MENEYESDINFIEKVIEGMENLVLTRGTCLENPKLNDWYVIGLMESNDINYKGRVDGTEGFIDWVKETIQKLWKVIKDFVKSIFGKKSEKYDPTAAEAREIDKIFKSDFKPDYSSEEIKKLVDSLNLNVNASIKYFNQYFTPYSEAVAKLHSLPANKNTDLILKSLDVSHVRNKIGLLEPFSKEPDNKDVYAFYNLLVEINEEASSAYEDIYEILGNGQKLIDELNEMSDKLSPDLSRQEQDEFKKEFIIKKDALNLVLRQVSICSKALYNLKTDSKATIQSVVYIAKKMFLPSH